MKWKIEKKYIRLALITLAIVICAILFQFVLEHETRVKQFELVIRNTISPIMFGFLLAYLLNPILHFWEWYFFTPLAKVIWKKPEREETRHKFSRALGVIFTILLFLVMIIGGLYLVIPQVYQSLVKIVTDAPNYYNSMVDWVNSLDTKNSEANKYLLMGLDQAYSQAINYLNEHIIPNMDKIVTSITAGIVGGLKFILNMVLALIISIYVMAEKEILIGVCKKLVFSVFNNKNANGFLRGVRYVDKVFGGFINGKIIDSFLIGMLCYSVMQFMGMEYTVLISIIIGITNIIPYFGPIIGAIPSVLILMIVDLKQGLLFAIVVVILQQVDGNIIGPVILGDRLNLSSMWILFAILVGGGFFGVPGMILGAPCFACIYALVKELCKDKLVQKSLPVDTKEYYTIEAIEEGKIIRRPPVVIKELRKKKDKREEEKEEQKNK